MYSRLSILVISILALSLFAQSTLAEDKAETGIDPAFRSAVTAYLKVQGVATTLGDQMTYAMAEQMLVAVANSGVEISPPVQDIVLSETRQRFGSRFGDIEFLTDLYAPIYAEHFSEKELQELTRFWSSPIGKKTIKITPLIQQTTQMAIQSSADEIIPSLQTAVESRLRGAGFAPEP